MRTTELGENGLEMARAYDYDIILFDLALPDVRGYEMLQRLRAARVSAPVLILCDRDEADYKVKAFGLGADAFQAKPFDVRELVAHIRAIVRRFNGHSASTIRTGQIVVNLDTHAVSVDQRQVHLTRKEYAILELLSLRKGRTVTKEAFLIRLYGGMDEPELKIIDVFVCKLRQKLALATGGERYIETVWGRGYVLRDPVPVLAATPVATSEELVGCQNAASPRAAGQRIAGRPQAALPLTQIKHQRSRGQNNVRDRKVRGRHAPVIGPGAKAGRVSSPVEMQFEDAVTSDDGPLQLPRPEPVHSLFGCATARCHE